MPGGGLGDTVEIGIGAGLVDIKLKNLGQFTGCIQSIYTVDIRACIMGYGDRRQLPLVPGYKRGDIILVAFFYRS